jgi:hypothetical protein
VAGAAPPRAPAGGRNARAARQGAGGSRVYDSGMPVRLTAFLPERPAATRWLEEPGPLGIGRAATADIMLDHPSVSREHAEMLHDDAGWHLADQGSKNGSFVDGVRVERTLLPGRAWLRFGDVHCEFATFDAVAAAQAAQRQHERRTQSTAFGERIARQTTLPDLLQETLRSVVALAECERGFLLQPQADGWRVRASHGLPAGSLLHTEFSGSTRALERALEARRPVVVNDTRLDPGFSGRASVITGGIRSLLALPVLNEDEVLALVYADRSAIAEPLTEFDVQLLEAFCERAALWIVARRGIAALTELPKLDWPSIVAAA